MCGSTDFVCSADGPPAENLPVTRSHDRPGRTLSAVDSGEKFIAHQSSRCRGKFDACERFPLCTLPFRECGPRLVEYFEGVCICRGFALGTLWQCGDFSQAFAMMIQLVADGERDEPVAFCAGQGFDYALVDANYWNGRVVFRAQFAVVPIPEVHKTDRDVILPSQTQCFAQSSSVIFEKAEYGTVFGSSCLQTIAIMTSMFS